MSVVAPQISLPDGTRKSARKLTYREARYVQTRLNDPSMSQKDAALIAGFPAWMANRPGEKIEREEVESMLAELQGTLAEHAVETSLIDAAEIHEYLTECVRADMRDIRNDDGSFKPQSEWPAIWGRMMEAGDCEIETSSERSHDGATKDKAGGWDVAGTVTKVKLRFARRTDLLKLAMQHRGVNAMASEKIEVVERQEKVVINLAAVCTIEQLEELRRRALQALDTTTSSVALPTNSALDSK